MKNASTGETMRTHTGRKNRRNAGAVLTDNGLDVATGTNVRPEKISRPTRSKSLCHSPGRSISLQRADTSIITSYRRNQPLDTAKTGRTDLCGRDKPLSNATATSTASREES